MTWQVITGDCLEVMPTFEAGSIDAIITDIPYGTTACSWDSVIPFEPMWAAIKHVLKPRGVFVTTASQPFTSALVMSNPKWFRYEWIWDKFMTSGGARANYAPLKAHENICVFSQNGHEYYPQMGAWSDSEVKRMRKKDALVKAARTGGSANYSPGRDVKVSRGKFPKSTIRINGLALYSDERVGQGHPTQKPVALYEYLIRTYTNEGETVLDMTAGSGTTGVAAINTGRNVILIEQRDDYADIARRRCAEAAEQAQQMQLAIG